MYLRTMDLQSINKRVGCKMMDREEDRGIWI